ncbi:MAG: ATPase [Candidatus Accumulibacter sp. 66-26]|nr:AAA family ATPase [Accumulibacter sp.]OJW51640.1 MAG: ATPase [Candidatus Accumulibacter sp. 66-26]
MYLEHFGLREAPFRITPHTEFFFAGANRGATLEALIYAITHDEGIVKVSGEVGSGKTMLCRMLLEKLPASVETVYLANPSLSRDEILHALAEELKTPLPEGRGHHLLRALQERLLEIYAAGRQVVVLIDEAHAMPPETLEEIRLLSNLESSRHKLLQIALFGQPELDERLGESGMRQLKERITHNFSLEPLHRKDIAGYLGFRLRAAGYRGPDLFTPGAIQLISQASEGLTRRINILADKALLSAFTESTHQIDSRQAKAAIRDAQFKPMREAPAKPRTWIGLGAALLLVAGLSYLAGTQHVEQQASAAQAPAPLAAPTAPVPAAAPEPAPSSGPADNAAPPPKMANRPAMLTLDERIAATGEWIRASPETRHFIQLLAIDASARQEVERFIEALPDALDRQVVRVYRSNLSGRDRIGVIYGEYASREAAEQAMRKLPDEVRASHPYARSVAKLR